jgi:hypothetical protein
VTNEVIGTVVEPLGFLQVTRILSGYSYAKALTPDLAPASGAPVKRFEQVPARFIDASTNGAELVRQFKANLPQFKWLEENQPEQALLTFALQGESLEVKSAQGDILHRYSVTEDQQLVSTAGRAPGPYVAPPSGPEPGPLQKIVTTMMGNVYQSSDERFADMDAAIIRQRQSAQGGIWLGPELNGHPSGLAVGDFDGDGQQETAVVLDNTLLIARISAGEFTQLAEVPISSRLQVLGLDAIDLDGNGRAELYLSAMGNYQPSSFVVEYNGTGYETVISNVRWLLRAMELADGNGLSLVGQRLGQQEIIYVGEVFHVTRQGDRLIEGPALELPSSLMNIFSFLPFLDSRNELNYVHLTGGDYLKVISREGREFWDSAEYFGGSENCFTVRKESNNEILVPTCTSPRMALTPGNEILVAQNDGQRMVQRYRKFLKSRVVSLSWNGLALVENWHTATQNGYLGDFVLADADNDGSAELVMAVKFKHKGLIDKARSSIVLYELR